MAVTETTTVTRDHDGAEVPLAGQYTVDASHSEVAFVARHLVVARTRGTFGSFEGSVTIAEDPTQSSLEAVVDLGSVDTRDAGRDEHLRSADFFDVATHPTWTFRSTKVTGSGSDWTVEGELTIAGITRPVVLETELVGTQQDPWGNERVGFNARTEINREDWGLTWNAALETGGFLVGKTVKVELEVEAVRQG